MRKLVLILAESSLELVPRELWTNPIVRKVARKRGKSVQNTLLDRSLHHFAMRGLSQAEKRGRPDIIHGALLQALGSPLNLEGYLEVFVHTIDNKIIRINPLTRLPKNYNRFVGLMEQLLKEGAVPPNGKPLLQVSNGKFVDILEEVRPSKLIVFSTLGQKIKLDELARNIANESTPCVVIGGFPRGHLSEDIVKQADLLVSIYTKPLETSIVVARVLSGVERYVVKNLY